MVAVDEPDLPDLQAALAGAGVIQPVPDPVDPDRPTSTSKHDHELHDFLNQPEPEYEWVIPDLAEAGDRIILTGPEGGGKSTLLQQIALQVAAGIHPFTWQPIPPKRTLLIDLENGKRHLRRKLRPLAAIAPIPTGNCRVISLPAGIDLLQLVHAEWLNARFEADQPQVVAIGPIYKMANGDPISEEVAKKVAYVLDDLRTRFECVFLIEAHQPYGSGSASRPDRPYGASLWSRWPEFGLHLTAAGQLRHWRGDRDERQWPKNLQHGDSWPWEPAPVADDDTDTYDGPSHCRAAVVEHLQAVPGEEFSTNQLHVALRARNKSYRKETISVAAEQAVAAGQLQSRKGPRNSRLYRYERTPDAVLDDPAF